ncbi:hypothetical protein BDR06DRAFT_880791, partial [Suillus hirtellus]
ILSYSLLCSLYQNIHSILGDYLVHQCLDIILEPLKLVAYVGIMLSDPVGHSCYCFNPLTSYTVDTLEAMMLAAIGGKNLSVTMAMFKQFGDPSQYKPQTSSMTLTQIAAV